ncbi:MAG TPA: hypothetical protein ENK09_11865 [Nitrospirae bacterium]|nr:hypothetical protein [Nitrospirota bacterium]
MPFRHNNDRSVLHEWFLPCTSVLSSPIYSSTHLPIYSFTHPPIHPSTHLLIYPSTAYCS